MEILTPDKRLLRKKLRLWRECRAIDVTQRNGCRQTLNVVSLLNLRISRISRAPQQSETQTEMTMFVI